MDEQISSINAIQEILFGKISNEVEHTDCLDKITEAFRQIRNVIYFPNQKIIPRSTDEKEALDFNVKTFGDLPSLMVNRIIINAHTLECHTLTPTKFFWKYGLICTYFLETVSQILRKTDHHITVDFGDPLFEFKDLTWILNSDTVAQNLALIGIETSYSRYTIKLLKRLKGVKKLQINNCSGITNANIKNILKECDQLEHLSLLKCSSLTDPGIQKIAQICKNLKNLKLQEERRGAERSTELSDAIRLIARHCKKLQNVEISGYQIRKHIDTVASSCTNLQRLKLQLMANTDVKSIPHFDQLCSLDLSWSWDSCDHTIAHIIKACKRVVRLNLGHCSLVGDHTLGAIAITCKGLKYIDISWCKEVTDLGAQRIAIGCKGLKDIALTGCTKITDTALNKIGRCCKELEALELYACDLITDEGIEQVVSSCHKLKILNIGSCKMITDEGVDCISTYCKNLKRLCVSDCSGLSKYRILTDTPGSEVIRLMKKIRRLGQYLFEKPKKKCKRKM